jgi:RNA polymerase sigma-70 factor (ECF subfamily)
MAKTRAPRRRGSDESRDLMKRAQTGDREAFDKLVSNYANMVVGLAYRLLGSREEAMDAAQDAFVRAWENAGRYDPRWSVATWLRRIVTNLSLDRLRRRATRAEVSEALEDGLASDTETPGETAERKEREASVRELLEQMPEKYRIVLVLRDMEDVDIADIARITGANAATVRWRLHRARTLFRQRWQATEGSKE